jgi:hypothetical protein
MLYMTRRQNAFGVIHPGPARREPLQRFLVDVLGGMRVGREQCRDPQQFSSGLGGELFEGSRLPLIHATS